MLAPVRTACWELQAACTSFLPLAVGTVVAVEPLLVQGAFADLALGNLACGVG